jgi:hypothetical protein
MGSVEGAGYPCSQVIHECHIYAKLMRRVRALCVCLLYPFSTIASLVARLRST